MCHVILLECCFLRCLMTDRKYFVHNWITIIINLFFFPFYFVVCFLNFALSLNLFMLHRESSKDQEYGREGRSSTGNVSAMKSKSVCNFVIETLLCYFYALLQDLTTTEIVGPNGFLARKQPFLQRDCFFSFSFPLLKVGKLFVCQLKANFLRFQFSA